ncbi:MAG: DMT family transporter, partial [Candidatus Methylomirabilales bacterium]
GAATAWGLMGTLARYLFTAGEVSPLSLTAIRSTLAVFMLAGLLFMWDRRQLRLSVKEMPWAALVGVAGLAMANFTYYYTISLTTVATAILLQYMAPILVAVASFLFLGERLTPITLLAITLAVGGCFLMVKGYDPALLRLNLPGLISGLLSACAFAAYILLTKQAVARIPSWTLLVYAYAFSTLFWWFLTPPWVLLSEGYSLRLWTIFFLIGAGGTVLPFALFTFGLTYLPATQVSIISTMEPVVAGCAGFLLLGEALDWPQLLGGALVITGVMLVQRAADSPRPAAVPARW